MHSPSVYSSSSFLEALCSRTALGIEDVELILLSLQDISTQILICGQLGQLLIHVVRVDAKVSFRLGCA